ncbi:MAG: hypothetical protein JRC87_04970, partial [Deltaproteobacteria bacterium]|nr:hypothetical protein [Deltaproteobacteria bacterium]
MKHAIAILILSFSLVKCSFASSELLRVSRVEHGDNIQLFFSFDKTPQFTENGNGKRINLIFSDTRAVPRLKYFGPDSRIVKILPHADKDSFILSIFFRYKPQRYTFSKSSDGKIVFEVLSGNRYSKSYKDLADRLKGLTILERNSAEFPNPYKLSPYSKNWLSFFSDYESPVRIDVSVQFNFPP